MAPTPTFVVTGRPLFDVCRLFGLAPFGADLSPSRLAVVYTLFVAGVVPVGVVWAVVEFPEFAYSIEDTRNTQTHTVKSLAIFFAGLGTFSSIVIALARTRTGLEGFQQKMTEVDEILYDKDVGDVYRRERRRDNIEATFVVGSFSTILFLSCAFTVIKNFTMFLFLFYLLFTTVITLIQFVNLVKIIRTRFTKVNIKLQLAFENVRKPLSKKRTLKFSRRMKVNTISVDANLLGGHVNINLPARGTFKKRLRNLRKAHLHLHLASRVANHLLGFQLWSFITFIIVQVTTWTYLILLQIINFKHIALVDFHSNVFMLGVYGLLVFGIASICHETGEEAKRTTFLVQRWQLADDVGEGVGEELKEFLQQLNAYKVRFSACGVFELDMTLLMTISSLVGTYAVILITA